MTSTKPYLVRAIYEWILDNQMTPHLVVDANFPGAELPAEFVENGRLVLNVAPGAVRGLVMGNDWIELGARFGGVARDVRVPAEAVIGIFTRENRQGMVFPDPVYPEADAVELVAMDEGGDESRTQRSGPSGVVSGTQGAAGEQSDQVRPKGKGPKLTVVK